MICNKCKIEKEPIEFIKGKPICKPCWAKVMKNYYLKNKDKILKKQSANYPNIQAKVKQNYQLNKDAVRVHNAEYYKTNKEAINKKKEETHKKRFESDSLYKLTYNIRRRIAGSIRNKGYTKKSKSHEILGCSFIEFKQHIESLWLPWMNWENYGLYNGTEGYGWDIDHKTPISSATCEEDAIRLNHYSNLQPLCSKINRDVKKNKLN